MLSEQTNQCFVFDEDTGISFLLFNFLLQVLSPLEVAQFKDGRVQGAD